MSHDPLHYVDSVNLYSFAAFDPINSWDPMGLECGPVNGGWVGSGWGVAAQIGCQSNYILHSNPNENSPINDSASPFAQKDLRAPVGRLRVYLVIIELYQSSGENLFNHSYVVMVDENGKQERVEGNPSGDKLDSELTSHEDPMSPFLGTPEFERRWKSGRIERVYEFGTNPAKERSKPLERQRNMSREDMPKYAYLPISEDEGNCHSASKACLDTLGLDWPGDDHTENPGSRHKTAGLSPNISSSNKDVTVVTPTETVQPSSSKGLAQ